MSYDHTTLHSILGNRVRSCLLKRKKQAKFHFRKGREMVSSHSLDPEHAWGVTSCGVVRPLRRRRPSRSQLRIPPTKAKFGYELFFSFWTPVKSLVVQPGGGWSRAGPGNGCWSKQGVSLAQAPCCLPQTTRPGCGVALPLTSTPNLGGRCLYTPACQQDKGKGVGGSTGVQHDTGVKSQGFIFTALQFKKVLKVSRIIPSTPEENHKHLRNKIMFLLKIVPIAPLCLPTSCLFFSFSFF